MLLTVLVVMTHCILYAMYLSSWFMPILDNVLWSQNPDFVLLYAYSGQRVIVQEDIEGQMVENVVTIQVEMHHSHKYTYK